MREMHATLPATWRLATVGWRRILTVVTVAAIVVGVLGRLPGLWRPYWLDEVGQIYTAHQPFPALFDVVRSQAGAAPLDFLGTKAFGFAPRLWPLLVGLASLPLIYGAARAWFGPIAGIAAAVLLAVNPFHAHYSTEVRFYALSMAFTIAHLWALRRAIDGQGWRWYVVTATLGLLTHYAIGLLLAVEGLYWLAKRRPAGIVALAVAGLMWLPWAIYALPTQMGRTFTEYQVTPLGNAVSAALVGLAGGVVMAGLLVAAALLGAWSQRTWLLIAMAAAVIVGMWVLGARSGYFWDPRHVAPALPVLLIAASGLGARLHDRHQDAASVVTTDRGRGIHASGGEL